MTSLESMKKHIKVQIHSHFFRLKILIFILTILFLLPYILFDSNVRAQIDIPRRDYRPTDSQSVNFTRFEDHIEYNDKRIEIVEIRNKELDTEVRDLQHNVTLWQGAVMGIGSLIAILEILQALGFTRRGRGADFYKQATPQTQ